MAKVVDKEKEIKAIMKDAECSREEAEEIFAIEQKARDNGADKMYAVSEKPRKKVNRQPKIDTHKIMLIDYLSKQLNFVDNLQIKNAQREITFEFQNENYSIVLTKHRKEKGG